MDEKNRPLLADRLAALGWTPEATAARLGDRSDRILIYRPTTPIKDQPPAQSDKPHMAPN
jgi:hypothetical protein